MYEALIITPVKNSIETTLKTIESIKKADGSFSYDVYNDFSTEENTIKLKEICVKNGLTLINLHEITSSPSPNYTLVLQMAQKKALENNLPLIIVESDVIIQQNTINALLELESKLDKAGLIGCITRDENGKINFPYSRLEKQTASVINTKHSVSFCCTLISPNLLKSFNFENLNSEKHWHDVSISRKSLQLGFKNYVTIEHGVIHTPHSSRPWKLTKYKNPIKYYFLKIFKGLDRI